MADPRAEAGKVPDELRILCSARKKSAQTVVGIHRKYSGADLKGLLTAQSGTSTRKHNYGPKNKNKNPRVHVDVTLLSE